tara:strand:+ start:27977 stop:28210 length:234 start_codon:yes stop_codon:yes gene_type:complete
MKTWLKESGKEIILNEEKGTELAARELGWTPKDEPKTVDQMTLEELHAVADSEGEKMAVNIGIENARKKVAKMLEAK